MIKHLNKDAAHLANNAVIAAAKAAAELDGVHCALVVWSNADDVENPIVGVDYGTTDIGLGVQMLGFALGALLQAHARAQKRDREFIESAASAAIETGERLSVEMLDRAAVHVDKKDPST